jgi:integrase
MRVRLTAEFVRNAAAEKGAERTVFWDADLKGFGLMVTSTGHRRFVVQYRHARVSRRLTLKPGLSLHAARIEAKKAIGTVARGNDPLADRRAQEAAAKDSLRSIAEEYFDREGKRLRTIKLRRATFERLIFPKFGARPIDSIRRSEIVRLLDKIEDESGPVMADAVLAYLRRLMTWYAGRSDDFRSPIVRGMARTSPSERRRERILTDDELRAVWKAAETSNSLFGTYLQFLILTAARRNEAAQMRWVEIEGEIWTIPSRRSKQKGFESGREVVLPLSRAAIAVLSVLPRLGDGQLVFTSDGRRPLGGFSKAKKKFDERCGVFGWTLHDLRRTARSLMSRAGVPPDIAERCLGHVIPGVRGIYDRHEYLEEKRRAFDALAKAIQETVNPNREGLHLR